MQSLKFNKYQYNICKQSSSIDQRELESSKDSRDVLLFSYCSITFHVEDMSIIMVTKGVKESGLL